MSKPKTQLRLATERLAELTTEDMSNVVGAQVSLTCLTGTETYQCPTLPLKQCQVSVGCLTGTETAPTNLC